MDKNQGIGLILIALMVIIYFQFFAPETPEQPITSDQQAEQAETPEQTQDEVSTQPASETDEPNDSIKNRQFISQYGIFAPGAQGNAQQITLENEDITLQFNTKGGVVSEAVLKKFKNNNHEPLVLFHAESSNLSLALTTANHQIDLYNLYYDHTTNTVGDTSILKFNLNLGNGREITHTYKLAPQGYELVYNLQLKGLDTDITKDNLVYTWDDHMIAQEKDIELSRRNSTINYYTVSEDFDHLSESAQGLEEENITEQIKWVALKQRFFVRGIIAQEAFAGGNISTNIPNTDNVVKEAKAILNIPAGPATGSGSSFKYYLGPNDYDITTEVADEFGRNLSLGWPPMKWVNQLVIIPLFNLLSSFIGNYGIIIIIMVFLIKLALSPLSYKSYVSMAKMKVLKPELDEIKEKHGDDMAKAQQEQMKLYQKVGVNPISGCIPMLLQMPILLAMFYFFPQSIELRQESFLWAEDLSTYDSILDLPFSIPFYGDHVSLFVLLMTVSTILITYSQQQVSSVQGPMKAFSYIMPLIFLFVLNSYPAALSFYYFVSNLVTFAQQTLIRRFIDEDKIRNILEENKKRGGNKKKSKFQQKLEEAMKANQQNQNKKK